MPSADESPHPFRVRAGGADLAGEEVGSGPAVLLLHGLTATRRYVLHGARTLDRAGYRVIAYDARGHGQSAADDDYSYRAMIDDAVAVLDDRGADRAAVVGQSMGAATAAGLALERPDRVAALGLITPAHRGRPSDLIDRWDRLASGLREGGIDGFLAELEPFSMPEKWRDAVRTVIRQRMERHADRDAVAAAMSGVQRTAAFHGLDSLAEIAMPTLVVGSQDEIDNDHPLRIAEEYARRIPGAELVVEEPGESPLAWRGGALSRALLELFERAGWGPASD